jgi:alkylhydroperoxidase family enzyme
MAFIQYRDDAEIPEQDRVDDRDHIIQVHSVNSPCMKLHFQLYAELMRGKGPLGLVQREMVATLVSSINGCHY